MASTWNDIRKTVDGWAKKVNRKAEQLTDLAALKLKLSAKRSELEEQYLKLGQLSYDALYAAEPVTDADALNAAVAAVTVLREEIATLEAKLAEQKVAKENAPTEVDAEPVDAEEEIDTIEDSEE